MREKIRIRQRDKNRILLTETLPYEIPIIFSNRNLYRFIRKVTRKEVTTPAFVKNIFMSNGLKYTIPYDYYIRQGADKERKLSIIHPAHQLAVPEFYASYSDLILSLCRRSRFSLRYPVRVASYFYEHEFDEDAELNDNEVDSDPEIEGLENKYASSYFYYSKFHQLYKFIDSREFLELERKFCYLKRFDVKRCFASIYTHTISWAVKGKIFAKENQGNGFDSKFDDLMMVANYQETNGIVVGPEISRIFAEIILQQVDVNIATSVQALGISDRDYCIHRYLDDYFLFTRSKNVENSIHRIVERELQEYKLYLNESKTIEMCIPFATDQTIAKGDVQNILDQSVLRWLAEVRRSISENEVENSETENSVREQLTQIKTPFKHAAQVIRDIKISLKRSKQNFNIVSGYALSAIIKSCYRLEKKIRKKTEHRIPLQYLQNLLMSTIEIVFFIYSMDFRVRTTYLISQFMLIINKFGELDESLSEGFKSQLKASALTVLDSRPSNELGGVETQNLLIALRAINQEDNLPCEDLYRYFNIEEKMKSSVISYFDIISILYVTKGLPCYAKIHTVVVSEVRHKIQNFDNRIANDCERTLLLVDTISCPFIEKSIKYEILNEYSKHAFGKICKEAELNQLINFFSSHLNFVDWSNELQLEKLLVRKQLNPGY